MHESYLSVYNWRFAKAAGVGCVLAFLLWEYGQPTTGGQYGGTPVGIFLGVVAAGIIVWLAWFGVRKRQHGVGKLPLRDWLSIHVWSGMSLLVIATLHTGFELGFNVHALAWVLMVLVIGSGMFGVVAYRRLPQRITANAGGDTREQMLRAVADVDPELRNAASALGDDISHAVVQACSESQVGGPFWVQISGRYTDCATAAALGDVTRLSKGLRSEQQADVRKVLTLLGKKGSRLRRARKDVQLRALIQLWLFAHVPLTVALLAALAAHIFIVLFFW